jgi:hypothetical protein
MLMEDLLMKNYKKFYCYSSNLNDWFEDNGLYSFDDDIHKKTGKKYWVFKGGRVLDLLLNEYRLNSEKYKQSNQINKE